MVIGHLVGRLASDEPVGNRPSLEVDTEHLRHAKVRRSEKRPDGHHRVAGLQAAGSRFDQEGVKDEVIVSLDDEDLGVHTLERLLERLCTVRPPETTAEDDDPRRRTR